MPSPGSRRRLLTVAALLVALLVAGVSSAAAAVRAPGSVTTTPAPQAFGVTMVTKVEVSLRSGSME